LDGARDERVLILKDCEERLVKECNSPSENVSAKSLSAKAGPAQTNDMFWLIMSDLAPQETIT